MRISEDTHEPKEAVHDPKHQLVESLKATTTPEAFVIRRDGDHWVVVYRGLIDNLYADVGRRRRNATQFYVREAIASAVAKKPLEIKNKGYAGSTIAEILKYLLP